MIKRGKALLALLRCCNIHFIGSAEVANLKPPLRTVWVHADCARCHFNVGFVATVTEGQITPLSLLLEYGVWWHPLQPDGGLTSHNWKRMCGCSGPLKGSAVLVEQSLKPVQCCSQATLFKIDNPIIIPTIRSDWPGVWRYESRRGWPRSLFMWTTKGNTMNAMNTFLGSRLQRHRRF